VGPKRTFEELEGLLADFTPAAPPDRVGARLLEAERRLTVARHVRRRRFRRGLAAAAAAVCLGLYVMTRSPEGGGPPPPEVAVTVPAVDVEAIEQEIALRALGTLRSELRQIDEIREIIPEGKGEQRQKIAAKLDDCLRRLERLEQRVRYRPGNSYLNRRKEEVNV
jgi:hypothetical protein